MTSEPESTATREARLDEVVAAYLQAAETGEPLDRQAWLARHPEFAQELSEFFADCDAVERVAVAQRTAAAVPATAASAAATLAPREPAIVPGTQVRYFGDYEVLSEIARGGMGVVFKARQVSLNRLVAVKMILSAQLASPAEVQRFHTEAEAAAGLDHPNIVPVHEVGEFQGQCYLSMKLVEGGNLAQRIATGEPESSGPGGERKTACLVATIARAIHFAHQRGIIHRDLKPANILFDTDGQPFVSDFGLAKRVADTSGMTRSGALLGTPSYMAPEQAGGQRGAVTTASDVYSLGAILYELLTGRPPFHAATPIDTVLLVLDAEPVAPRRINPQVSSDLEAICLKCLEKDPQRRYNSAAALAEDLEHWLAGEPTVARPPGIAQLIWIWLRKNVRATLWTIFLGVVCGGVGSALFSLIAINELFVNMAKTYENYPGVKAPLLAHDWLGKKHGLPLGVAVGSAALGGATWASMGLLLLARRRAERRWLVFALCGAIGLLAAWFDFWIRSPFFVLGLALLLGMGLFIALLVGTKSVWGDLNTGIAAGLVAGVASFTLGFGQAIIISTMVVQSLNDLQIFGLAAGREEPGAEPIKIAAGVAAGIGGYTTSHGNPLALVGPIYATRNYVPLGLADSHPGDFLVKGYSGLKLYSLKGYPDLDKVDPGFRGMVFFPKIVSDQVSGAFTGIWLGMTLALNGFVALAVFQTLVAGYLLRNRERPLAILFPYLEVTVIGLVTGVLAVMMVWALLGPAPASGFHGPYLGMWALLAAFAGIALVYRWPWHLRLLVLVAWLLVFGRLDRWAWQQPPWYVDAVCYMLIFVQLAYYYERRRHAPRPIG